MTTSSEEAAEAVAVAGRRRDATRHHWGGVFLVLASASAFGVMPVLARIAFDAGADVFTLLALRFCAAAVLLWGWVIWRHRPVPRGKTLVSVILLGLLGYVTQSFTFFTSLQYADVSIVAAVAYTYPLFVMILAAMLGRDPLTRLKIGGMATAVTGAVLVVGAGGQVRAIGIALVLCANLIYAFYVTIGERVIPSGFATGAAATIMTSAGVAYAAVVVVGGEPHPPATTAGWLALLGLIVGPTVIGVTALIAGLQRLKPMTTATISVAEPVVAVLLAVLWLSERLVPLQIVGLVLTVAAVVTVARWTSPAFEPAARPRSTVTGEI